MCGLMLVTGTLVCAGPNVDVIEGAGTRTQDLRIKSPLPGRRNPLPANTCGDASTPLALQLAQDSAIDPDLQRVQAAWPSLPDNLKAAILAMIGEGGK